MQLVWHDIWWKHKPGWQQQPYPYHNEISLNTWTLSKTSRKKRCQPEGASSILPAEWIVPTELPCSIEEFGSGDKNSFPQLVIEIQKPPKTWEKTKVFFHYAGKLGYFFWVFQPNLGPRDKRWKCVLHVFSAIGVLLALLWLGANQYLKVSNTKEIT